MTEPLPPPPADEGGALAEPDAAEAPPAEAPRAPAAGEQAAAEAPAGACRLPGEARARGSEQRRRAGEAGAGATLSRHLAEVLQRLSEHEALLGRLLEEQGSTSSEVRRVAEAQASAAAEQGLMLQHLDRKMERALKEADQRRPSDPPAAPQVLALDAGHEVRGKDRRMHVLPLAPLTEEQEARRHASRQRSPADEPELISHRLLRRLDSEATQPGVDDPMGASTRTGRMQLEQRRVGLRKIVESSRFDMVCALVIVCNAVTIGIEAQSAMEHALEHKGSGSEWQPPEWLRSLQLSFMVFYALELVLKLAVHRSDFFFGTQWGWNCFDFALVVTAIYEVVVMLALDGTGLGGMTWLRLLRILKTLKMLRIFRLMRFFRELRMMMASLLGSCMALVWSVVMLAIIKWVVGLMFIQCLSSYLLETPVEEIDAGTLEGIVAHWPTILESMCTLFKATTGGNDWAELADPIRVASASGHQLYYVLFLLYIIFFIVALLNVLTGMFVDAAVKVGNRDNEEMVDLVIEDAYSDDKVGKFREFILNLMSETGTSDGSKFSWEVVSRHRHSEPVKDLFRAFHLDFKEARKVFKILEMVKGRGSLVSVEEFITVCETKLKNGDIEMLRMEHEIKRIGERVRRISDHMEASSWSAGEFSRTGSESLDPPGAAGARHARARADGAGGAPLFLPAAAPVGEREPPRQKPRGSPALIVPMP